MAGEATKLFITAAKTGFLAKYCTVCVNMRGAPESSHHRRPSPRLLHPQQKKVPCQIAADLWSTKPLNF